MTASFPTTVPMSDRDALLKHLFDIQQGKCFIGEEPLDLTLQDVDVDHVHPRSGADGKSDWTNYALTCAHHNRSKQASDLRIARVLAHFERIEDKARNQGREAPNLGDILAEYGGARYDLPIARLSDGRVRFTFKHLIGDEGSRLHEADVFDDRLAQMRYFFALLPIEYLHHDSKINPRGIGRSLRGLVEEFYKGNPQLHVSLGWVPMEADGDGRVMLFDGQHKAAAQILLGERWLPVRIFLDPNIDRLIETNTNAGSVLRQVAFDKSILRHLGSELYADRVRRFQRDHNLGADDETFSEEDLVRYFSGEARSVRRYVLDAVRDQVLTAENRLRPYIEFGGKGTDRPISYSTIDKTFFSQFIGQDMLNTPIGQGAETGDNPRILEVTQIRRLMDIVAEEIYEQHYDLELGTYQVEAKVQKGVDVPDAHLRATRMGKEELMGAWLKFIESIIQNYYVTTGGVFLKERIFQTRHPEQLWLNIRTFIHNLAGLPMWVDHGLSLTAFGARQRVQFWDQVFKTGRTPEGTSVLPESLNFLKLLN
jgi:hypothetical protein